MKTWNEDEFVKNLKNKKVVFFGANNRAKKIKDRLEQEKIFAAYFVDNDKSREFEKYMELPIHNPIDLLYEDFNEVFVVVMIKEYEEVYDQLKAMGFEEDVNFICPIKMWQEEFYGSYKKCNKIDPHFGYSRYDDYAGFTIYGDVNNKSAIRIVTLGGSTTDSTVSRIQSWPQILQKKIQRHGFEVVIFNGGIISYGVAQEFLKLSRDVLALKPDIVLSLSGVNDVNLRTSYPEHPMIHIYQDLLLKHIVKKEKFFCAGVNTNINEVDYGIKENNEDYLHWIKCIRMMHAVESEFNIDFLAFLQPMLGLGTYKLNEKEKNMLKNPNLEIECRYGLHEKLVSGIDKFYKNAQKEASSYEYIINIGQSFDGMSDLYTDLSHVNEKGNDIIAQVIFDELCKRGMLEKKGS